MLYERQPQKRWRWVVLMACFLSTVAGAVVMYSFGAFVLPWMEAFSASGVAISVVTSGGSAVAGFTGPFGSFLVQRLGYRTTHALGGLLIAITYGATSFATSLVYIFFTYSLLGGFGTALCLMSFANAINDHFDDHREIAFAIVTSAFGVGGMIFPLIFQTLIEEYGWRGAMLICSGIMGNVIICGLVTYPVTGAPPWPNLCECSKRKEMKNSLVGVVDGYGHGVTTRPENTPNDASLQIQSDSESHWKDAEGKFTIRSGGFDSSEEKYEINNLGVSHCEDENCAQAKNTAPKIAACEATQQEVEPAFKDLTKAFLTSWSLFFMGLHNLTGYMGFMIIMGLTPIRASFDLGLDDYQAAFLVSMFGIAQLVVRLSIGVLAELKWIKPPTVYFVLHLIGGIMTLLSVFADSFVLQVLYCTIAAASLASYSFYHVIVYKIYERKLFNIAIGYLGIMHGIGTISGPFLGGYIFDVTGTSQYSFVFAGICITFSAVMLLLGSFVTKDMKKLRQ